MKTKLLIFISAFISFVFPETSFGQVPNLKSASDFVLFTTTGGLGNTGVSEIYGGAVGTNFGAIIGFNNINCIQHNQDNVTAQCALDLQSAFIEIHNIPTTQTIVAATLSGATLVPGVYLINSAVTLASDLTLDAQNEPDAVFIFNVTGAFGAAAATNIILINGALAQNVYWNIDAAIGFGAGASMKGSFLSLAGAISIGAGASLEGRALTIAGAVTIDSDIIVICLLPVIPGTVLIQPSCSVSTGTITINAPLGPDINYSIDDTNFENTTGIFTNVPGGYYKVTAKNQDGCLSWTNVAIISFGHAPDLKTASDFLLFTSAGAVGNTGASVISGGAVGTNFGAITGFGSVSCVQHTQDGATAQCSIDLQAAFNEVHNLPITQTILAAELSGGTLIAGVYHINSAVTLTSTLTLDAQGNQDALFVFNVTGAFGAAAASSINLVNGASENNIFWNIDAAISIGAGAAMKGTFLSLAGAIDFGDGASLAGRALTMAGAVNIYNNTFTVCIKPSSPTFTLTQPSCAIPSGTITIIEPTGAGMKYRIDYCAYTNTSGIFTALSPGTYFVTAKNSSGCISPGTFATITPQTSSQTWNGYVDTEWNNPANWCSNTLPTISDDAIIPDNSVVNHNSFPTAVCKNLSIGTGVVLTIGPGKILSVSGILVNNSSYSGLVIKSDASGTGSLLNNSTGVQSTVDRYMNGVSWAWHFLSSPVSSQPISGSFTPSGSGNDFDFYTWYEPELLWVNFKNTTTTPTWNEANGNTNFLPGSGYLVAYQTNNTTKAFTGVLNTGQINYTLTQGGGSTYKYYNLVGNPYPCSIDWKAPTGWNMANLSGSDKSYWIWNDATGNYGVYTTATSGDVGTNGVTRYISISQGFFVLAASTGNFTMNDGVKVGSAQAYLKNGDNTNEELKLKLSCSANAFSDEAIVEFNNSNPESGSEKFSSMYAEAPELWTVKDGNNYSINFMGDLSTEKIIPLTIKAGLGGNYTLSASQLESFGTNQVIQLEDRLAGTFANLAINPSVTFNVSQPSTIADRFFLHFKKSELGSTINQIVSDFRVYVQDRKIIVQSVQQLNGKVIVTDMAGRNIANGRVEAGETIQIDISGHTGVYIVSVLSSKEIFTTKIIVK